MCENNCPMTFLWWWNDSSERGASQGQRAWWLTKDCLWFDTVISAHKRNGYISYSSSPCITHCISFFSAPTLACDLSLAFSLRLLLILFLVCCVSQFSLNLTFSLIFILSALIFHLQLAWFLVPHFQDFSQFNSCLLLLEILGMTLTHKRTNPSLRSIQ